MIIKKLNKLIPFVVCGSVQEGGIEITQLAFYESDNCEWYSERGNRLSKESCEKLNELLNNVSKVNLD